MANADNSLNVDALEALQILECPVCLEVLNAPVFQCANGHLICSSCLDQVNTCPTCRRPMPQERIRNLAVENLVTVKCPNFKWGCQARLNRRDKEIHALNCKYSSADYCRRIELKKVGFECSKMISKLELPLHMKNVHKLTVIENNEAVISQELNVTATASRKWFPVLFSAFDDYFFFDCEKIFDETGSGNRITWKCISAGSVAIAQQFFVTMTLFLTDVNDMGTLLKWKGKVISIDQLQANDLNSFSLNMNTLKDHMLNKRLNKLPWKMHVLIQRYNSFVSIQNQVAQVVKMNSVEVVPPIYQIIEGTYQHVSGERWWGYSLYALSGNWNGDSSIVYSQNGSLWTRKAESLFEYSFTFGQEVTYQFQTWKCKTIVTIENNKLIHRTKLYYNGAFEGDVTEVEEFSGNKMVTTDTWDGDISTAVYKKVNG